MKDNDRKCGPDDLIIADNIRKARQQIGMSQETLSEKLGLTFQQVQKYERGTNRVSGGRLKKISKITGFPILWFYDMAADDDCRQLNQIIFRQAKKIEALEEKLKEAKRLFSGMRV